MLSILKRKLFAGEFIKFVVVGLIGTALTYLIYLALLQMLHYQAAFAIAYVIGIIYSYLANSKLTFKEKLNIKKFILYPVVYVVQYLLCAALLYLLVSILGMHKAFAPLIVIAVTTPLTFVVARYIIKFQAPTKRDKIVQ